jgi:hypothetical protein
MIRIGRPRDFTKRYREFGAKNWPLVQEAAPESGKERMRIGWLSEITGEIISHGRLFR